MAPCGRKWYPGLGSSALFKYPQSFDQYLLTSRSVQQQDPSDGGVEAEHICVSLTWSMTQGNSRGCDRWGGDGEEHGSALGAGVTSIEAGRVRTSRLYLGAPGTRSQGWGGTGVTQSLWFLRTGQRVGEHEGTQGGPQALQGGKEGPGRAGAGVTATSSGFILNAMRSHMI